jgi:serine/threonine protein kinase/tetratricopeptide (TPR) repeat protein
MADGLDKRAEELFQQAADLPDDDRPRFLDERCGADADLRGKVEALLRHEQEATASFLAGSPVGHPGPTLGKYKVLDTIGEGAFGDVYLAEQTEPVRRKVALKVLKAGMDTRQVIARFEAERQALAMMDHPNIARVFDAGVTDAGRPYFAMEYVPGVPITEHCDTERLDTEQRLQLLLQVCDAIQHAHQKAVIHRDLKPSNILVELAGDRHVPKVIDFGIAKAVGFRLTERTLYTEQGQLIGTPEYMSPEQAEMSATNIDTRTDIYSLGVVLYELLVGASPFDPGSLRSGTLAEIQRRIREQQPPAPSTRLSRFGEDATDVAERRRLDASGLRRRLKGDLDWITMKAMEKERSRRYASASELAADIERHLINEPVLAGPPSTVYRLGKFVRRNKAVVAGVTVAFAALAVGTGVATWQATRARAEAHRAIAIKDFLANTIGAADFIVAGRRLEVADVLDEAAEGLQETFAGEPQVEAEVRHLLGLSYFSMSEFEKSLEQLRAALEMRRQILGENHRDTLETAHRLGDILVSMWQHGEAEEILRDVVERRRRTLGPDHPDALWSAARLTAALNQLYRLDEAEALGRAAADGLAETVGRGDERTVRAYDTVRNSLRRVGKDSEADELHRGNLGIARRSLGPDHRVTVWIEREYAYRLYQLGQWAEAEPLLRSTLEKNRRLFGDDDYRTLYFMETFGQVLCFRDQAEEGRRLLEEGIDGLRRVFGERHLYTAYALGHLAAVERVSRDFDSAESLSRQCTEILSEWLGDDHPNVLGTQTNLAYVLRLSGKHDEAEALLRGALDRYDRKGNAIAPTKVSWTMKVLAGLLEEQSRLSESEALWRERVAVLQRAIGNAHPVTLAAGVDYGRYLLRHGRFEEAEAELLAAHNRNHASALAALIELYDAWDKPERAAEYRALLREAKEAESSD